MQINITNPAYQHASKATNNQRCVNMYPLEVGPDGRGLATLKQRYGKILSFTLEETYIRAWINFKDVLYIVAGSTFYKINIDSVTRLGTGVSKGTIGSFSGFAGMACNSNQIIIIDGSEDGWIYSPSNYVSVTIGPIGGSGGDTYSLSINGTAVYTSQNVASALSASALITQINTLTSTHGVTASSGGTGIVVLTQNSDDPITVTESGTGFTAGTDGLTVSTGPLASGSALAFKQITDPDFLGGSSVAFLDGYFFISKPDSNLFYASQINDGFSYDPLDFASAEINQSNIVKLIVKNRELWIYKKDAIEVWYDAANASGMPLAPRVGSELDIGTIAPDSIVNIDNTLYWLDSRKLVSSAVDSDKIVNQTTGNTAVPVSTGALNNAFALYEDVTTAIGAALHERGHPMYQITIPRAAKTWVYDIITQVWHERNFFDTTYNKRVADNGTMCIDVNGLTFSTNGQNAAVYVQDITYYDDAGEPIRCVKTTQPFSKDFKLIGVDKLEVRCDSGNAPPTALSYDPQISMRFSHDGGRTWSNEESRSLGAIGNYGNRIIWNRLGSGAEWEFEFSVVAPLEWAIVEASVDISEEEKY